MFMGDSLETLRIAPNSAQIDTTRSCPQAPAKPSLSRTHRAFCRTPVIYAVESEGGTLDRKVVQPHGFAAFCVAVATTLRYFLGLLWPDITVFATYYPAALVATLVRSVPAGITATLLAAVSAWWLFLPPTHQFIPIEPASAVMAHDASTSTITPNFTSTR
jgi:Domain of unknown function (DUF4118)